VRLVFIGPPGIGKGTYAKAISQKFGIPHISTGDIFREEIAKGTELGRKVREYVEKGLLVPDEIVIEVVRQRLSQPDCAKGFILDGFPRTLRQAEVLDSELGGIDLAILFYAPLEVIIERVSGRRICPKCGAIYHIKFMPPKNDEICDRCGTKLIQREDDKPEVVRRRYEVYLQTFEPVIRYYREKGKLVEIFAGRRAEEVIADVERVLREKGLVKE